MQRKWGLDIILSSIRHLPERLCQENKNARTSSPLQTLDVNPIEHHWEHGKKKIPNYDIRKKELRGIKSAST